MIILKTVCTFLLIMLMSCHQPNQKLEYEYDIDSLGLQFLGLWQVVPWDIPYGALITVDSNHTFTYIGGGCLWHFGSSGTWRMHCDTLFLTSRDTTACLHARPFGLNCFPLNSSEGYFKGRTIKDCEPEGGFFEYIIFSNERFLLNNDTLFHIRRTENPCPQAKDNFYRVKRKGVQ